MIGLKVCIMKVIIMIVYSGGCGFSVGIKVKVRTLYRHFFVAFLSVADYV